MTTTVSEQHQAGGAATHAGTDYQNRASAWLSIHILAEQDASPPWDLPAAITLEWIRCETEQPVDDILAGLSQGGVAFIQAKHSVNLSTSLDSDLAASIKQFVRQLVKNATQTPNAPLWNHALEADRDRLVLVTGRDSSAPIRSHLPSLLARLRSLKPEQPVTEAARNNNEKKVLEVVTEHITHFWTDIKGMAPTAENIRELLCLIRVHVLEVDPGETGEREAKNLLRHTILEDPTQADLAWSNLITDSALCARGQSGVDRKSLQRLFRDAGLPLKAVRSYRSDIERLRSHSQATLSALAEHTYIRVGDTSVKIDRISTQGLADAVRQGSLVVVGEPGAGKSGALYEAACSLIEEGRHVVVFAAEQLSANSLGLLRQELNLEHEVVNVLSQWEGAEPGILAIDALDAIRTDAGARTLRELIRVVKNLPQWHVVVSIRKFDLRKSLTLWGIFPVSSVPLENYQDPEFVAVRHFNIPLLTEDESNQVGSQSEDLAVLITRANADLALLLKVPFNLRLAGELLGIGAGIAELTPIRTQIELLDRYWQHRVIGEDANGYGREAVLEQAVTVMVSARMIRAETRQVVAQNPAASAYLNEVLQAHVLVEWQPTPNSTPDRAILTFSHHILYDYAVARLMLRGLPEILVARLESDPDLVITIRPSLVMNYQYEWLRDPAHELFWQLVFAILGSSHVPEIGKVIGLGVAADMVASEQDLQGLTMRLQDPATTIKETAEQGLRYLVQTLLA